MVPVILKYHKEPRDQLYKKVGECVRVTRQVSDFDKYLMAYTDIMVELLEGKDLRTTVESVTQQHFKISVKQIVDSQGG